MDLLLSGTTFVLSPPRDTIWGLYIILWACCASIFLYRLNIIYSGNRAVRIAFTALYLACVASWIVVVRIGYKAYELPTQARWPWAPKCVPVIEPVIGSLGWVVCESVSLSYCQSTLC